MKTYKEQLAEQLAEHGCYAENTEVLFQSFKQRLAAESGPYVLTARQQVRLAAALKVMEDPFIRTLPPVQMADYVTLLERIVLEPERFEPPA